MKRLITLINLLLILSIAQGQLSDFSCSSYSYYKELVENTSNFSSYEPSIDLTGYGKTQLEAAYHLKIELLKYMIYGELQNENPLLDTIMGQFAHDLIKLQKDHYVVAKSRKKADKQKGKYFAYIPVGDKFYYNKKAIEFLKDYINEFMQYTAVFINNPYITDKATLQLYNDAKKQFEMAVEASDYKFNNVLKSDLINFAELPSEPSGYSPCKDGFKIYKTGQRYLDFIEALRHNENFSYDLDLIFSVDSITVDEHLPDKNIVRFTLIAYNINSAVMLLNIQVSDTVEKTSPYQSVQIALTDETIKKNVDKIMYEIIKRYATYVKEGIKISIKICDDLLKDTHTRLKFEKNLLGCKAFHGLRPGTWTKNGVKVGRIYTGTSYILDRMTISIIISDLLSNIGINDYEIHIYGTDFIITPKL